MGGQYVLLKAFQGCMRGIAAAPEIQALEREVGGIAVFEECRGV